MSTATPQKFEFQAEIKQLLDIVIHSLYTEKEIFVRELVSNASDALEKLRHTQITEKEIFDDKLELEINVTTDDTAKTITIQDFGVGMSRAELTENLGTIAHSGSKAFLKALGEGALEAGHHRGAAELRGEGGEDLLAAQVSVGDVLIDQGRAVDDGWAVGRQQGAHPEGLEAGEVVQVAA
jgi:hypothetical protein